MFTKEEHATRALGAALQHDPQFAVRWLQALGLKVACVDRVEVERTYVVPDDGGKDRRADVYLEVSYPHDGSGAEATHNGVVILEAKVDALVDDEQLQHAQLAADTVVCLLPDELPRPSVEGVLVSTWEELVHEMTDRGSDITAFLAEQFALLVDSPRVRRRRRLAMLVSRAAVPAGWRVTARGESTSGNALGLIYGPSRGDLQVHIELANEQRGHEHAPYAYVLVSSTRSSTDPVVIDTLNLVELPPSATSSVVYRSGRGRRTKAERKALDSAGVPGRHTYGYGQRQLEKYGWSGYGAVVDLTIDDYSDEDAKAWLDLAIAAGEALDDALGRALGGDEGVS